MPPGPILGPRLCRWVEQARASARLGQESVLYQPTNISTWLGRVSFKRTVCFCANFSNSCFPSSPRNCSTFSTARFVRSLNPRPSWPIAKDEAVSRPTARAVSSNLRSRGPSTSSRMACGAWSPGLYPKRWMRVYPPGRAAYRSL